MTLFVFSCEQRRALPEEFTLQVVATPCTVGGEPNLFVSKQHTPYLSWIEYQDDTTDVLLFSKLENGQWTNPIKIASGNDWFVNWADFPSIAVLENEQFMAAHWLQKSAAGVYDYDVRVALSNNGGQSWSDSFVVHQDSINAEHGFVSLIPFDEESYFITWLDGRNTKTENETSDHGHGHGGAMTLRAAFIDVEGDITDARALDRKVCDCCQTDAIVRPSGPVVVYRDRSYEEIRDISIVRKIDQDWTQARNISLDRWQISACPVNGPALAAEEGLMAVAWYTGAKGDQKVQLMFSQNNGADFTTPIRLDNGMPLGRVDLVVKNEYAFVSWIEQTREISSIMLGVVDFRTQKVIHKQAIQVTSPSRKSGFPILEIGQDQLILAWTEVDSTHTQVKTGFIPLY